MSNAPFRQPSVMSAQHSFSQVPAVDVPRSRFDRSHGHKTTFDAGRLIPIMTDQVLPGDTKELDVTMFARLATPLHPIMDNAYIDTHCWFVPYRLLYDKFQNFMGERDDPDDDPNDYSIPQCTVVLGDIQPTSQLGYLGIPKRAGVTAGISVTALKTRAVALIYNEWYRDQNLQDRVPFSKGDGPDDVSALHLADSCYPRGKRKDYFTGALPWPQKGDPVTVPLGESAPITGSAFVAADDVVINEIVRIAGNNSPQNLGSPRVIASGKSILSTTANSTSTEYDAIYRNTDPVAVDTSALLADLSVATAISINDLRTAFQIQRFLERDARGGTRYIELIFSHFRVTSDDARLQRPEFLGGGTTQVVVNPVASTATVGSTPQANLAAVGTVVAKASFKKSFTEHGLIVVLASARADLTYQQGIDRDWFWKSRNDFPWPVFAHLGEQAILNREIYAQGTSADTEVFGYQERYAECRYKRSMITGLMSSEASGSLDVWHLSQDFGSLPQLNASFIEENPPIDRVIAVPSEPHFIADIWFKYYDTRPLPTYAVPGMIDHY